MTYDFSAVGLRIRACKRLSANTDNNAKIQCAEKSCSFVITYMNEFSEYKVKMGQVRCVAYNNSKPYDASNLIALLFLVAKTP
jgi:hypothetical protein